MARLYAAARLYVNFFQPSFKLKEKRREGAKVIKRYHPPSTPYERALAHPKVAAAVKPRLREQYRTLDPVALLAEIRAAQEELGNRVDRRAGDGRGQQRAGKSTAPSRCNHQHRTQSRLPRRSARRWRPAIRVPRTGDPGGLIRRVRMPSKLDPHVATIERLARCGATVDRARHRRPAEREIPRQFGTRQHSIVQRLLRALRKEGCREPDCSGAAWRRDDRYPIARACGRLGL